MKSKISILIYSLSFLTYLSSTAQERINAKYIEFENVSDTLKKATGWYLDPQSQKWIENENAIYKQNLQQRSEDSKALAIKNFNYIVANSNTTGKEKTYTLTIARYGKYYKYPAIKEDLIISRYTTHYIFTESEFRKLDKIQNGKIADLKIKAIVHQDNNNPDSYKQALTKAITQKPEFKQYETFRVTKSDDGNIRFLLPQTFYKISEQGFDKAYFETDEQNFSKIILK